MESSVRTEVTQLSEIKSVTSMTHTIPMTSDSCTSCPDLRSSGGGLEKRFELKEGEMLFDREGHTQSSTSLSTYVHTVCASNVFSTLFVHNQIVQRDLQKCCASFHRNPNCNRFADIHCYEDTRVRVKHPSEEHDYIHASWVDGYREPKKFIICQSPLPQTMEHFWLMQWQEKTTLVISMIQMYNVDPPETSLRYVPTKTGEVFVAGEFSVEHQGTRHVRNTFDATVLKVTRKGESRRLLSLIYHGWDDKGTPKKPQEMLTFIADMNHNRLLLIDQGKKDGWLKDGDRSPISINCLAGTGRSCVVVALDIICRKLDDTSRTDAGPMIDVEDTVMRLRTQRAMAVQKPEQYLLIQMSALEYAIRMKYVSDKDFGEMDLENYKYKQTAKKENKMDISTN